MNLEKALSMAAYERVVSIAQFYGISLPQSDPTNDNSNINHLASLISKHLLVPQHILLSMKGLNEEELRALKLLTLAAGGRGVVVEQCHQRLNQISKKWRRNGAKVIEALITRGLVFTRREGYRHIYFVPTDLNEVLSKYFLESIFDHSSLDKSRLTPRNKIDWAAPLRHICLFLSYVRKYEVRLTQAGTMFKRQQNELSHIINEDSSAEDSFYPIRYPPRLAFLVYFAKSLGLTLERDGMLQLSQKALDWMKSDYSTWRKDLFEYWKTTFVSQDTDLYTMLWLIMHGPESAYLSLSGLLEEMYTLTTNHSAHGLDSRVNRNLIDLLEYQYCLEVADNINGTFLHPTPIGKALMEIGEFPEETFDTNIYVQSNYELMIPCTIEPKLLWCIDTFAELLKPDQMMMYKLTRSSVYQAMVHGYSPEMILDFLHKHSKVKVPQNVSYSIEHWGRSYGRIEFEDAILMKCDSEELANELMLSSRIRPYVQKRLGPCYLAVSKDCYNLLVAALSEEGYMPKVGPTMNLVVETEGHN